MKQEILDKLKLELGDKEEMDPDKHDGSYQLVREIVKILSKYPIQKLGPKDLNMLYFATVGTFSKSINDKINNIKDSSLSKEDKDYLLNILDGIWKNVSDGKYENNGEDGNFGMFGTGIGKVRASDSDSRLFLGMCIKLISLDDEEKMFSVVENTLKNPLKYIGIAIVSQILHCLKPFVFPIFNNATQELGLSKDTTEYIENTRKIEKFRNENFKFKNYRIFDMGLWDTANEDEESISESANNVHYRLYAPGENAYKWDEYYESGYMGIGWDEMGDISLHKDREAVKEYYIKVYGKEENNNILACYQFAHEMKIGDIVIVKKGKKKFIGYGVVTSDYIYDDSREEYKSVRKVNWIKKGERDVGKDSSIVVKTLTEISEKYPEYVEELKKLLGILPQSSTPMNISKPMKDLNTILYGAPGTGKTYNTINYALSIIENKTLNEINKEDRTQLKERFDAYKEQGQIVFCTFHQSLSYEEFIEGIKANSDNGAISYDIGDGIFKSICKKAMVKSGANIDEVIEQFKEACDEANGERITIETATTNFSVIYKGGKTFRFSPANTKNPDVDYPINIDNIKEVYTKEKSPKDIYNGTYSKGILDYLYKNFGLKEYNTLDDGGKNYVLIIDEINRGNMSKIFGELITLLEPSKRIGAEEELKVKLPYSQDEFGVPQNLYVIGTMNTADRSIALIDIALRRRFTFKEIEPNSSLLNFKVGNIDIQKMFETINERIEFLYDRDHKLGHSFFMPLKENNSLTKLNEIFYNNIIPLLQEYFYEDWEKIQIVLGDHAKQTNKKWEDRLIQEEIQSEAKIIGFNHEDIEDKVKYTVNNRPIEKSYLGIYSKTIDEKTE